jgi:CheY-like chemotaxis protein/HPt (histidine-containing phosphotransfer) domain-containing protein
LSRPGLVTVHAGLTTGYTGAAQLEIRVVDNGIGMDEETRTRLFQAFIQADASTTRRFGGTGLGLAICHQLVQLMGGQIMVDSEQGRGSCFTVMLPCLPAIESNAVGRPPPGWMPAAAPAASIRPLSRTEAQRHGRLILVAEDNETNQQVIQHQLALLGFAAEVTANGQTALARWQSGDYALLLTDLHMPEMDGYQLTAAIRAQERDGKAIPIVALTANTSQGEAQRCLAAGMNDYLSKPVQLSNLRETLAKWLAPPAAPVQAMAVDISAPQQLGTPVKVDVLAELVGSDPAVLGHFLRDFRHRLVQTWDELLDVHTSDDPAALEALAHKLKSSSRTVGAIALGELYAELEHAAASRQAAHSTFLLARIEAEIAAVRSYLDELLA